MELKLKIPYLFQIQHTDKVGIVLLCLELTHQKFGQTDISKT